MWSLRMWHMCKGDYSLSCRWVQFRHSRRLQLWPCPRWNQVSFLLLILFAKTTAWGVLPAHSPLVLDAGNFLVSVPPWISIISRAYMPHDLRHPHSLGGCPISEGFWRRRRASHMYKHNNKSQWSWWSVTGNYQNLSSLLNFVINSNLHSTVFGSYSLITNERIIP